MYEKDIFQAALEISDPHQRQAYLDQTCAMDTALRRRVDALLAAHDSASQFLNVPVMEQQRPSGSSGHHPKFDDLHNASAIPSQSGQDADDHEESDLPIDLRFLQASTKSGSLGRLSHYEILQVIGQGAFGIVFKAFDEKLHRHVAVKMMSPHLASTSPPRKRFLREARSVAALKHENIVQIYSVEEQPLPYLAMEFVDGQTLQQKLDSSGPLEVPEILHLGRQMAAGLAAAHDKGFIHRDIKPSNILLEAGTEQTVKITDFGLARAAEDATMTRTGVIAGTPMYMAPEQAMGQTLDHRADLFSLGSVLYQMTCGRPPFRGENAMAVLKRVIDEMPRPIQDILPQAPDWLCAIIEKLQAKNPVERYQTAKEVADVLARCQNELQVYGNVTSVPAGYATPAVAAKPVASATASLPTMLPAETRGTSADATQFDGQVKTRTLASAPPPRRRSPQWLMAVAGGALALVLLGGIVIKIVNNNDIKSERQGPDGVVAVQVERDAPPISKVDLAQGNSPPQGTAAVSPSTSGRSPPLAVAPFDAIKAREHQAAWASYLGQPVEKEIMLPDGERLVMVLIPPGEFIRDDEGKFPVRITKPFYLGKYEVTQAQWQTVMGTNPSNFKDNAVHPVEQVSWYDIQSFLAKLNSGRAAEPWRFELPTEAQWEYAARAGTTTAYSFGDSDADLPRFGWFANNSGGKTHPVGQLQPNSFGAYDMHGNVWEWCADWHEDGYYAKAPQQYPPGPSGGSARVLRVGSWRSGAEFCRMGNRGFSVPTSRFNYYGFRVALSPSGVSGPAEK